MSMLTNTQLLQKIKRQSEWNWNDTELVHQHNTKLTVKNITQLLITRGAIKKTLRGKIKIDLIRLLKQNYNVNLNQPIENLTSDQVSVELKLRRLKWKSETNINILISRLKVASVLLHIFIFRVIFQSKRQ